MTALERITAVLERARIAGGWIDEEVAKQVLNALGLDDNGAPSGFDEDGEHVGSAPT